MPKKISKRGIKWIIAGAGAIVVVLIGFHFWNKKRKALPDGIAAGNGRIEGKLADVSAKEPLRVKQILVDEGALVKHGQVLVKLDTVTLDAELVGAKANIDKAEEHLAFADNTITKQQSEIKLSEIEAVRSQRM